MNNHLVATLDRRSHSALSTSALDGEMNVAMLQSRRAAR